MASRVVCATSCVTMASLGNSHGCGWLAGRALWKMNQVDCECEGPVIVHVHMCWNVHSGGAGPGPAQAGVLVGQQGTAGLCQPLPTHGGVHKGLEIALDICNILTLDCV